MRESLRWKETIKGKKTKEVDSEKCAPGNRRNCARFRRRYHHPFLTTEFLDSERENIPNLYLPNADTWVFEVGGKVVGFVALIGNEIGAIFVHPSQQRNGVGSQLMEKAKELHSELEVEVFAANTIGRGFYAKHEFETLEEKVHDQTRNDLLRLRLA